MNHSVILYSTGLSCLKSFIRVCHQDHPQLWGEDSGAMEQVSGGLSLLGCFVFLEGELWEWRGRRMENWSDQCRFWCGYGNANEEIIFTIFSNIVAVNIKFNSYYASLSRNNNKNIFYAKIKVEKKTRIIYKKESCSLILILLLQPCFVLIVSVDTPPITAHLNRFR